MSTRGEQFLAENSGIQPLFAQGIARGSSVYEAWNKLSAALSPPSSGAGGGEVAP